MSFPFYYDRYAKLVNVTYDSSSDEEAVYGIDPKSMLFAATKGTKDYLSYIETSVITAFKKGALVDFETGPILDPKSEYTYILSAKDFFGNAITLVNNTGTFRTCKSRPQGAIELVTNVIGNTEFKINVADPDQSSIPPAGAAATRRDLYLVVSTKKIDNYSEQESLWDAASAYINNHGRVNFGLENEGTVHFAEKIDDTNAKVSVAADGTLTVTDYEISSHVLDLNTKYYVYLLGDYDLDNNVGPVYHDEIGEMTFKSATLSSLGNIYVDVEVSHVTAHGANIIYTLNKARTNDELEQLLSDVIFTIDTDEGDNAGVHSAIVFDSDTMKLFTGWDSYGNAHDYGTPPNAESASIMMDARYFDGGASLPEAQKNLALSFKTLKNRNVVPSMPPY